MRKIGILMGTFAIGLIAVNLLPGQQQPQKKFGGGFGGFGGFGGKGAGAMTSLTLINNESVKKELEITQEQTEKIPAAVQKALAEVLNEKQLTRLRQIELQQLDRVNAAFNDARVKKELSITEEQSESIKSILDEATTARREIFKEAQGGNFQGIQEKMTALDKETKEKLQGVLTASQKKQWRGMLGDEFKLETPGFGGLGGFGGKGKKKKDAE